MSDIIKISGKIAYQDLGTGFWGIIGDDGREWLPTNLPTSMEVEGKRVRLNARPVDGMSMFMWGTMIEIIPFKRPIKKSDTER